MKSLTYEQLMSLDEDSLKALYPTGARSTSRGRWIPSDDPEKTLDELLKEKEKRVEKPRYMRQSYSVPRRYLEEAERKKDPKDGENDNYTYLPSKGVKGESQEGALPVVPAADQKRYSAEGREKDRQRAEGVPLWQLVRQLEEGGLPERQKASIRRRVEAARRALAA